MSRLLVAVFSDLESHSVQWSRMPSDRMVKLVSEYRHLAESMASQHGCLHRNFIGDGHLFLFENPDAAIQFGFRLIQGWRGGEPFAVATGLPALPLRVGCHFGECVALESDAWIGRGITLAKRVETVAAPDALYVTESVLSIIDLPLYGFEEAGGHALKGDHLPTRTLYRITSVNGDALVARTPDEMTAEGWFLRGVSLAGSAAQGTLEEAECYKQALRLRENYPEAHNNLAVNLRESGDLDGAAAHYRRALHHRPNYPEAHYNYGLLLERTGSMAGAKSHYEEALRLRAEYAEAHHALANLLKRRSDQERAITHYVEATRIRPVYPEAHNDYAIALEDTGQSDVAEDHYKEALAQRPTYKEAHYNYALLLERLDRSSEARQHYEEALRLWPDYPEARNNLAVLLHMAGDLDAAAKEYQRAISLRPNDPEAHYNYGLLLEAKGEAAQAARHIRLARELAPDSEKFNSVLNTPG
jgi:tetratricopeptide (TPR) repeat protein/class 3 adenylate cyclase